MSFTSLEILSDVRESWSWWSYSSHVYWRFMDIHFPPVCRASQDQTELLFVIKEQGHSRICCSSSGCLPTLLICCLVLKAGCTDGQLNLQVLLNSYGTGYLEFLNNLHEMNGRRLWLCPPEEILWAYFQITAFWASIGSWCASMSKNF